MNDSQITTSDAEVWAETVGLDETGPEQAGEPLGEVVTRFIRSCWMRRKMFVMVVAGGVLATAVYALLIPNAYTSMTTLMPPDNSSPYSNLMSMLTSQSGAAGLGSEALGLNTPGELFVSILQSRTVKDSLVVRFDLMHYYHSRLSDDARKALSRATIVDEDRKSGVISVSVTANDPILATNLARGYVEELNRVVTDDSTSAARRERIFLEGRVQEIKRDLDDSSRALSQFSTKSKTIDMPSQTKSMVETGLKLQADLIEGRSELAALKQVYSDDNSRVKAVEARNAELQRQIDAMGGISQQKNEDASSSMSGYPSASELPSLGLTYYDLERKVLVDQALWEALTKEYESAKVEEAKQIPTVRVLDVAQIPQRKSSPIRRVIVLIGALISFLAACLTVFVMNHWEAMDCEKEPKKMFIEAFAAMRRRRARKSVESIVVAKS